MLECRHCGEVFREDPERLGARCLRCRMPFYDRTDALRREETTPADAKCAKHPLNWAISACQRCGEHYCALCRSRWRDQTICLACVEVALTELQQRPKEIQAHKRQAISSLIFGLLAWVAVLAAAFPLLSLAAGQATDGWTTIWGAAALLSLVLSLVGMGLGSAAIRARGRQLVLATVGLCLCGAQVGAVLGLLILPILR